MYVGWMLVFGLADSVGHDASRRGSADETTERLLEAASAEFVEHGYDAARVNAIARRAGVTSGAVYSRWPTKSDIMVAALEHIFGQVLPSGRLEESAMGMRLRDKVATVGASLMAHDQLRDVVVQVFGSARNNEAIRECLQRFLEAEAQDLSGLVAEGKEEGLVDPELSTAAMSWLCQSVAIGSHLLQSAGMDDGLVPTVDEWDALIWRLMLSVAPPNKLAG